ncbi:MAG: hypothetical protein GY807_21685 [Gammaproteobacteria bacterium]|nr:hypothetical protein [Gammaproteobacteria bacterium]
MADRRGTPAATLARQRVCRALAKTAKAQRPTAISDTAWHWVEAALQAGQSMEDDWGFVDDPVLCGIRMLALMQRAIREDQGENA